MLHNFVEPPAWVSEIFARSRAERAKSQEPSLKANSKNIQELPSEAAVPVLPADPSEAIKSSERVVVAWLFPPSEKSLREDGCEAFYGEAIRHATALLPHLMRFVRLPGEVVENEVTQAVRFYPSLFEGNQGELGVYVGAYTEEASLLIEFDSDSKRLYSVQFQGSFEAVQEMATHIISVGEAISTGMDAVFWILWVEF